MDYLWLVALWLSGRNPYPAIYVIQEKDRQRRIRLAVTDYSPAPSAEKPRRLE